MLLTGYFGGYSTEQSNLTGPELAAAHQMADAVAAQGKPLVVQTIYPDSPASQVLRAVGIPVHRDVDRACTVLAGLVEPATAGLAEELPAPAPPVTDTSYDAARALFGDAGVAFPVAVSVTDAAGLEAALDVRSGLPRRAQGDRTAAQVRGRRCGRRPRRPGRGAGGVRRPGRAGWRRRPSPSRRMADLADGVELIVGSVRDPKFGSVVMVGLGGIFTEVLGDTACAIAPVSVDAARELLLSLQGAPVLLGARGRAPVDLDALAERGRPRLAPRGRPPRARRAGAQPGARRSRWSPRAGRAGRPRLSGVRRSRRRAGSAGRSS